MDLLQLWWDVYASYRRTHGVKTGWTTSSPSTLTPKWTSLPNLPTQLPTHPSPSTPQGSTHAPWAHMDKYQWPEHEFDNGLMQSLKSLQITGNQHGGQAPFSSSLSSDKDKRRSGHKEVSPTQPALVGMQHNFSGLDATTTTATTFPSPSTPIISSSNPTMVNTNKKQSISSASIPTESSSGTKKQTTSTISTIEVEKETKSTHPTLPSMSTRTKSTEATSSAPQISTSSTPVSSKSSTTTTTTSNTNPNPTTSSGKGGFSKFFGKKN
ncbi:hypothetical protein HMI54_012224 [Coelomomyces lativittatus]|nr:hypothetical protein HMI54_012224 [Coelomomyces lativittatus]